MAGMVPEDVYELTGVADPRLHPDGRHVAYVHWWVDRDANEYRSAIWLATVDGSEPSRRLTAGERRDSSPRWSPDGTKLAFTSNRGGEEEKAQVYVLPFAGGEAVKLTELKEDAVELAWSPDGATLAFSSRVRDEAYDEDDERKRHPRRFTRLMYKLDNVGWTGDRRQHLFLVRADASEAPRQLTTGDFEHSSPAWSPDGQRLAFISARDDDWDLKLATDVYVLDIEDEEAPRKLTSSDGECDLVVWSPDGSRLAFLYTPGTLDWPRNGQGPGWGTVDYEDLMAAVDTALERYDFIDHERLGVLGGSYGGFMTSWIVSKTNRFKAACSEPAVNNLISAYRSNQ